MPKVMTDKELKAWFKKECESEPEKHYPVKALKELGFKRGQCEKCKTFFWSAVADQLVCGDPTCSGGFRFIGKSPAKYKLDYIQAWRKFAALLKELGYTEVKRYPCVARWNPTTDFTIASIAAFQPYVVSGEVAPPAKHLVIPQFCLRFSDIDNVGITGAHYTGFIMWGQAAFVPPEEYDINKYLKDIYAWLSEGLGLPKEEITWHEDAWAGGGNYGPSVEFYSRGLELGNQVYMQYEQLPNGEKRELRIKVLDMGEGSERIPWFTHGTNTSFDATFPTVMQKLYKATKLKPDYDVWMKYLPYAAYLNVDEVEDIDAAWKDVAKKIDIDVNELKKKILPIAALYSIAEHTRTLLFAITDGALPSNVGGMYNLRVILRRALSLIEQHGWKLTLPQIAQWHAEYLGELFPELKEHLGSVQKILNVEEEKYATTKQKTRQLLTRLAAKKLNTEELIELYDSHGIEPELIAQEAKKLGKHIEVPKNFYALVAERHEKKEVTEEEEEEMAAATRKAVRVDFPPLPDTKALYFNDYRITSFDGKVLAVKDNYVVLDQTAFYPTSGGQLHDLGKLDGAKIIDVFKQGNLIIHKTDKPPALKPGQEIHADIDAERRIQLAQHHTSTHIVNAAAKKVLGRHINQAGAKKDMDKATIDITHYAPLAEKELEKIEKEANKIVKASIKTNLRFMPRNEAELQFGHEIYQGGAVPGKQVRIVEIPNIDVEACGGTHLLNTNEAGTIKIIKSSKIKDGIVRITFAAGRAAKKLEEQQRGVMDEAAKLLNVKADQVPARAGELFTIWKKARKAAKKGKTLTPADLKFAVKKSSKGNLIEQTAESLQTQPEHILTVIKRFLTELEKWKKGPK